MNNNEQKQTERDRKLLALARLPPVPTPPEFPEPPPPYGRTFSFSSLSSLFSSPEVAIPGRTIPKEPPPLKGPVPTGAKRQPIPPELRSIQIPKMPWDEPCSNDEPVYELIENPVPQPKSQLTLDEYLRARRINRQLREAMWNPNITTQQLLPVYLEAISFISARDRVI
ncbi:hypothetical protein Q1695_001329 [Nippostrongylus brasiliensis]|nr:hypothetical protein Q1695_001329 [Nippostrongylus brasiliensis]